MSQDAEYDAFVQAAWPRLRQAAYALTLDTEAAEDLLQTVLVRIYVRWGRVGKDDPVAYARRSLVNGYIDQWRRRRRMVEEPTDQVPDVAAPGGTEVEDRLDLESRLARLTQRERTMVVMRYYLDLREVDVAQELGCSVGTVKSTCSRALQSLRIPQTQTAQE